MQEQVVTKVEIEKTNKVWKKTKLIAFATAFFGVLIASQVSGDAQGATIAVSLIMAFLIYLGARIGAWWTNG